ITGMGTVNPLGLSVKETWQNAINGVSGLGPITLFDTSDYLVNIACEVKDFVPENFMAAKETRRRDRYQQFAFAASQEAIQQAGLEVDEAETGRVGVIVSSGIGGLQTLGDNMHVIIEKGPRRISPFVIPMLMVNGAAGLIAIDNGFKGPSFSVSSACASGADGIGVSWTMLKAGTIDVAIAGASEAAVTELAVAAFDRMSALSRQNNHGAKVPKPFDLDRDGLVMGEGAGILVLEREAHAIDRGAEILAELAGYAASADAYHITAPSVNGVGGAQAIRSALKSAQATMEDVGYINAHGTATKLNDLSETRAIKAAFGDVAYKIPISSTKSMTGHMMGATGALEAIFCVEAIRDKILPPTINYETPDPECDLDYVPNIARDKNIKLAISNAFGFGGHNAVLVVKEYT
ncbi:MAG: beta-ketoacyl-ACP synthase II, partial [Anaerolineales bacterium]